MSNMHRVLLAQLEKDARELATSRAIVTEEGRSIMTLLLQLIEIELHGEVRTKPQPKHHI